MQTDKLIKIDCIDSVHTNVLDLIGAPLIRALKKYSQHFSAVQTPLMITIYVYRECDQL